MDKQAGRAVNLLHVPRAVACPDKYRGTLSATEAAAAIAAGLDRSGFDDVVQLPLADGRDGFNQVIVAVGGSATTDGGLGAVDALGWSLQGLDVTVACDVSTVFGDAATVYGPQKGASSAQIALLTRRLQLLAQQYSARTRVDVTTIEGGGAAGGLAGGLAALGARLAPGFDVVAEALEFERALEGALLAVTGEGRLDATSLEGKVVAGVLDWAEEYAVPNVCVVAGQAVDDARKALEARPGVRVLTLTDRAWQPSEAYSRAALLVEEAAVEAGRGALQ